MGDTSGWRPCGPVVAVGLVSTLAYVALYAMLRTGLGPQASNLLALLVTAAGNAVGHTRVTFAVRSPAERRRHRAIGTALFVVTLAATSSALSLLSSGAHRTAELGVLLLASLGVTALRFLALRRS